MSHSDQHSQHLFDFQLFGDNQYADFSLYDMLIRSGSVLDQADDSESSNLPSVHGNENHVFDRGKH